MKTPPKTRGLDSNVPSDLEPSAMPVHSTNDPLVEGVDYTLENGLFVLTRNYLLKRGRCCGSGCRNCPYDGSSTKPRNGT